jgi:hypothetical protein
MINALLCCACLGLDPKASLDDMEFAKAQIEMIASYGGVWRLDQALPRRQALLIRQLGCNNGGCRELAAEDLSAMKMDAFEALTWGTLCRDPAIVESCLRLLRPCYTCRTCCGEGRVQNKIYGDKVYRDMCPECQGSGDMRFVGEDMEPRKTFAAWDECHDQ